ncbi:hypothetical protein BST61_g9234 [Cercospora zeina]
MLPIAHAAVACIISIIAYILQDARYKIRMMSENIATLPPLPSPREDALALDIDVAATTFIESLPTARPPVHDGFILPTESPWFPYIFFGILISVLLLFCAFSWFAAPFVMDPAIEHGDQLYKSGIEDRKHDQRRAREKLHATFIMTARDLLHIPPVDDEHLLERLHAAVASISQSVTDAKKSKADANFAAVKALGDLSTAHGRINYLAAMLETTTEERDKAHHDGYKLSGEKEKLIEAHTALQQVTNSLRATLETTKHELTSKAREAAQASAMEMNSANAKHAELMDICEALECEKKAIGLRLEHEECECANAREAIRSHSKEIASAKKKTAEQKAKHNTVLDHNNSLQKRLDDTVAELADKNSALEDLQKKLDSTQSDLRGFETELSTAQELNDELTKRLEAGGIELDGGKSKLQSMKEELSSAQTALDSITASSAKLTEKNEELKKQAQEAEQRAFSTIEDVNEKHMLLGQDLLAAQDEVSSLRKEIIELRSRQQPDAQELSGLQKKVEELQNKLEESDSPRNAGQTKLKDLQSQLGDARGSIAEAREATEEAQERHKKLEKKHQSLKKELKECRSNVEKLEKKERANDAIDRELDRYKKKFEEQLQRADDLNSVKTRLEWEKNSERTARQTAESDLKGSRASIQSLRHELEAARGTYQPIANAFSQASQRIKELEAENTRLKDGNKMQKQLDEKQKKLDELVERNANGSTSYKEMSKHNEDLKHQVKRLKQDAVNPQAVENVQKLEEQIKGERRHHQKVLERAEQIHFKKGADREKWAAQRQIAELRKVINEPLKAIDAAESTSEQLASKLGSIYLSLKYGKSWLVRCRGRRASTNQNHGDDDGQKPDNGGSDQGDGKDGDKPKENDGENGDESAQKGGENNGPQPEGGEDEDAPRELDDGAPHDNDAGDDADEHCTTKKTERGTRGNLSNQKRRQEKKKKKQASQEAKALQLAPLFAPATSTMNPTAAPFSFKVQSTTVQPPQAVSNSSSSTSSPGTFSPPAMPTNGIAPTRAQDSPIPSPQLNVPTQTPQYQLHQFTPLLNTPVQTPQYQLPQFSPLLNTPVQTPQYQLPQFTELLNTAPQAPSQPHKFPFPQGQGR